MKLTIYSPREKRERKVATYENGYLTELDLESVPELVGYYMRYHFLSGRNEPEFADGAVKFGNRIRILARNRDESAQRLFDICSDGTVVNPNLVKVDPETGMP